MPVLLMKIFRITSVIPLWLIIIVLLAACSREYSFEQNPSAGIIADTIQRGDTTKPADTVKNTNINFPVCSSCIEKNDPDLSTWSFKTGNNFLCGVVDTAILNYERTSFTFFGPSFCAGDTGLIFTVYMSPYILKQDTYNFTVPYAVYYYYHTGTPHILSSQTNQPFKLTITSYIHSTRIATGIFSGTAFTVDNKPVTIHSGKFKIKLL
jgi:hypothetical protein